MTMWSRIRVNTFFCLLALFVAIFNSFSYAQVYSGTLTGLVSDPSGAIVPGAQVVLTDEEKGYNFTAKTDNEGRFVLRNLAPGRYRLVVSAAGMRTQTQTGIYLERGPERRGRGAL